MKANMLAARIHLPGGPEAIQFESVPTPTPSANEALVKLEAVGVNFIDVYKRSGAYKVPLPSILGEEAAGTVVAIGASVTEVKVGDRVAYASAMGAYAQYAAVAAAKLVPLPDAVKFAQGAAVMLQGMTAHYLSQSIHQLGKGVTGLVHAGAGGVGLLLTQIGAFSGGTVITTVGSDEKAEQSLAAGADHAIVYTRDDFVAETRKFTENRGVNVVFDSVGQSTFLKGLDLLTPRGMMVLFGQSSGAVAPMDPQLLNQKGSIFLTRPTLAHYTATRRELLLRANDLFKWIGAGDLNVRIGAEFPLSDVAHAHRALESRATMGKVILHVSHDD